MHESLDSICTHYFALISQAFEIMGDGSIKKEKYINDPLGKQRARTVDKISRKLFPTAFLTFNAVYWMTYIFWEQTP